MLEEESTSLPALAGALVGAIVLTGVLLAIGFVAFPLLGWAWIAMGVLVYVTSYLFGPWPGGEPGGTYVFMLLMYCIFPPAWGAFVIYDNVEYWHHAKTQPS